ncbi:MAG: hypothetical protein Kow00117_11450 [Phototrophicales bacterium]
MSQDIQSLLQAGIQAAKDGNRATGRRLLTQVVEADPDNDVAWMWLASCMTTVADRRRCLERVLELDPTNIRAKQALLALGGNVDRSTFEEIRTSRRAAPAVTSSDASGAGSGINWELMLFGGMILGIILGGIFVFSRLGVFGEDTPPTFTPLPVISVPTQPRIPTLPPIPTATLPPFRGTFVAPTLPPTFTPTPIPSDTPPPPTSTPYPQGNFLMLYTSLQEGAVEPDLYQITGDGLDNNMLGSGFRDVAFAPDGRRIAFIRDVTISTGENTTETYPELFIASLDNLAAAQQITDLRTEIVASPSWSPEARELVFISDYDGDEELWYVLADGSSQPVQVTFNQGIDRDPAWRPVLGSREILIASDLNSYLSTEIYSIQLVPPDEDVVYTQLTNSEGSSYAPAWNATGSMITFISDRQGDPDVYIMMADGNGEQLITRADGDAEDRSPAFSPDGSFIAFISNREDDRFQLYLIGIDGDVLTRLTFHQRDDLNVVYRPELFFRLQPGS